MAARYYVLELAGLVLFGVAALAVRRQHLERTCGVLDVVHQFMQQDRPIEIVTGKIE